MSVWVLIQIVLNVLVLLGFSIIWLRLKRPPKDDPRLSRGLQLLQSKITVLEDLSDRTDRQVTQLTTLLDQKTRVLQSKIFDAEKQIQKVQGSMDRSLEVAEIFQDKIPHDEIIDRQNTIKYIRAARLAHGGKSVDEILMEVDLPREQVEFIAKVNKDKLMFDDQQLPGWASKTMIDPEINLEFEEEEEFEDVSAATSEVAIESQQNQYDIDPSAFDLPSADYDSLKKLGAEFRQACETYETKNQEFDEVPSSTKSAKPEASSHIYSAAKKATQRLVDGVNEFIQDPFHGSESEENKDTTQAVVVPQQKQVEKPKSEKPAIQRVVFPRIDLGE